MRRKLALDSPAAYQLEIQGYLEEHWADWMDGASIVPKVGQDGICVTRLTVNVSDQAALQGLLRKLYDLGLPLLAVKCLDFSPLNQE